MARGNDVRGPTSALTDFLRESGITPTTVARRVRTQQSSTGQPAVSTSTGGQDAGEGSRRGSRAARSANGYTSDHLDESEEEKPAAKKRKLTKAAEAKLKAKEKANAKAKAKKKKTEGDDDDVEEDAYTALSKSMHVGTKPPVGSFEDCVKCEKQFTVTKYTIAAHPPPGFLCHQCAKASGSDPFKKPAVPRKRTAPADKRKIVSFVENHLPSLVSICIEVITRHIEDVEALGDIGSINMDKIAKALSRSRSLTPLNAPLFYNIQNTALTLYDATKLTPPALCTLASLNPNLTSLRLDFCGCIDDTVLNAWCTSIPYLTRLELLGPFLVRVPAWISFFKSHPELEGFLITQSPRFDVDCMKSLISNCASLKELRLKEVGKLSDDFLEVLESAKGGLTYLDLSYPGKSEAISEDAAISLMKHIGSTLHHLDLSGNKNLTDKFLTEGVKPNVRILESLILANLDELTDAGIALFFSSWTQNPALKSLDMSRNHGLSSMALEALLKHSGLRLAHLNINGWKATSGDSLKRISQQAKKLVNIDFGWCRAVDNFVIKGLMDECDRLKEVKCWGCNNVTLACPRKRKVNVYGVESQNTN